MARRWSIGLVVGAASGALVLVAGPIGGLVGLLAIVLAVAERPRASAIGGVSVGLGMAWLALLGRVALACRQNCVAPDPRPWLAVAAAFAILGGALTVRATRRRG